MIQVIDNIIPIEEQNQLKEYLHGRFFQWYYTKDITNPDDNVPHYRPGLSHMFFIDGVNNLCSLNFLIILIFIFLISRELNAFYIEKFVFILILSMAVFVLFNFYGKNFLGDGGVYGFSFLIGIVIIQLSSFDNKISPYFFANLLWYPAFENLFSIVRRSIIKKKNYIADNYHIHHLIFNYFHNKKIFNQKYLLSSFIGIAINCYLTIFFIIGYLDYSDTKRQVYLILINVIIYIIVYIKLKK